MTEIRLDYVKPVTWPDGGTPGPARAYARVTVDKRPLDLVLLVVDERWQVLATPAAEQEVVDHAAWPAERTASLAEGVQDGDDVSVDEAMGLFRLTILTAQDELIALSSRAVATDDSGLSRLVYAEDLVPGMVVARAHSQGLSILADTSSSDTEWCTIVEIREFGHLFSAILIRPTGDYVPAYWHRPELVRVRVETP